ncbi:ATP-dependent DNA helicase PcrA [Bacillus licheniformis]|uniref:UvrD-helicase domain-containing protein n=1 Tax=Bacillus haynesii TaxID=1925021 RepID=UPI00130BB027|nr:UvrD-helicase domain-containing protein [Bacillus haynesii]MCY8377810.1 UvrD-helicase domain-containing protein [Bacillus haynesii]MEC0676399.1 UvrD-helicase domain-containing protein [Bacillus haynesii]TWK12065.1 ATP-dependent DNA helicase PcrA [Bacillus licheniformis]
MQIKEKDYKLVEKILLGDGHFNSKQREFIELNESKTIVAGPGAGKTTALAAKIALLLKNLNRIKSKDGVCIITHTNVAVNEINNVLSKTGVGKISHPHFIGTIHEFFNRYCVIPFFKYKFKHNALIFDNEHKSDLEFYKTFLGRKNAWMNTPKYNGVKDSISERIYKSALFLNRENNALDVYNSTAWDKFEKYKEQMLEAKCSRKEQGFLTHEDTFLFSSIFLLERRLKEVLRYRFKYVFLDEFQDTTSAGTMLLEDLFGTENNIYQKVGDPYQTISFNQPMPYIDEQQVFRLNKTNRFGNEIAEPLNVIMPNAIVEIYPEKRSFAPVILLYKNEEEIYAEYQKMIKEYEVIDQSFKESTKEDKVLVYAKKWSARVKKGVPYKEKKQKKIKSENGILKSLILDFIVKKIVDDRVNLSEAKLWISNHHKLTHLHTILIDLLKNGFDDTIRDELKEFINELLQEKGVASINARNNIFNQLEVALLDPQAETEENKDDIFTIHSVKGETLRSVLVVDFDEKPLTNILLHRYGVKLNDNYLFTDLNLLYVAMSRVTHLFVFAMHIDDWTDKVQEKLKNSWEIRESTLSEK